MYHIYKITNTVNKKVYIGMTVDIEARWKNHLICAKNKNKGPLYVAINEFGIESFTVIRIRSLKDKRKASYWERFHIIKHSTGKHGVYNRTKKIPVVPEYALYGIRFYNYIAKKNYCFDKIAKKMGYRTELFLTMLMGYGDYPLTKDVQEKINKLLNKKI